MAARRAASSSTVARPVAAMVLPVAAVGLALASLFPRAWLDAQEPARGFPAGGSTIRVEQPLFASADPLPITITADFALLRGDRTESPDRPATVTVADENGRIRVLPIRIRTRGAFRLDPANCSFPPLRLDFDDVDAAGTPFAGQGDLKLVSSCRPGRSSYEQLVLKEYLAYRAYAQLTRESLSVRRLELTLVDEQGRGGGAAASDGTAPVGARVAFVIEEAEAMAARIGGSLYELPEGRNLPADAFDPMSQLTTAVFEYMIGNTDWSDVAGHNVEIVDRRGAAVAVPYDFDMAGLVDAPYSTTDPDLRLASVRERRYRGWCGNPVNTRRALDLFREAHDSIVGLWSREPGLSADVGRRAIGYLEMFFDEIATDEWAERRFLRDCRTPGGPV